MAIRPLLVVLLLASPAITFAADMKEMHEDTTFHMMRLETDLGDSNVGSYGTWDLDGWVGGDTEKVWLRSEGDVIDGKTEEAELWALYSRNIATFWDAQVGVRYDWEPVSTTYFVAGFEGLAPYYFETKAHFFLSDDGDLSARLREENDFLLTQRLIAQPYAEINVFAQDVRDQNIGAGLADAQIGLQTRYEITRKFAPYVDVSYERKFGETGRMAEADGQAKDAFIAAVGLQLMF